MPLPTYERHSGAAIAAAEAVKAREDAIRLAAYSKWVAAGSPPSDGVHDWLEAEAEWKMAARAMGCCRGTQAASVAAGAGCERTGRNGYQGRGASVS
jgi:Protein of unknown function (DUF2934)